MNQVPRMFRQIPYKEFPELFPPSGYGRRALNFLQKLRERTSSIRARFLIIVMVPTFIAAIYYGAIASKRFVSEAEYIVRGVSSSRANGLSAILTSFGISRAADDTSAIQNFMESRDCIRQLMERLPMREIYSRPEADFFSRFKRFLRRDTFENFFDYTGDFISVIQDPTKGITTLQVISFRPEDSKAIAETMLALAEEMVNKMNERAQRDTVSNAHTEVELAEQKVVHAQADLTAFRNKELLVDPLSFSSTVLGGISKLSLELAQVSTQIREASRNSPTNPSISPMQARAAALEQSIGLERKKLAGDDSALAGKVAVYENLTLQRDLAEKSFASALIALESARREASRQQIYIEEMVRPNLPDDDTEPRRLRVILTVFVLSFGVFSMLWILTVGAKDHAQ
jgi:capsular polysaccharide transport system permease protein